MMQTAQPGCFRCLALGIVAAVAAAAGDAQGQGLPTTYDLRFELTPGGQLRSFVPGIQNQGQFGDCWTFASATAMDSNLLLQGILPPAAVPPAPVVSSWALSTANGAPESIVGPDYGHGNGGWGGWEFQAMAYVTRGQGSWQIPGTVASSTTTVSELGGGPMAVTGTASPFAYPGVFVSGSLPANIGSLVPPTGQAPAFGVRAVTMLDQNAPGNVPLPAPTGTSTFAGTSYPTYTFALGALDPQVQVVKQAIFVNGAVTTSMNAAYDCFFQTGSTAPYTNFYVNQSDATAYTDHEVTIIGWDDGVVIPASAAGGVSGTGGWLVQNSWGTGFWCASASGTNDGTFWVSYNDAAIGRSGVASFTMQAALPDAVPVLQNEVGPLSVGYSQYSAPTLPTGMAAVTTGTVHGQPLAFSGTVVSVLTGGVDCTLTAVGVASQMAGATVNVNLYSQWVSGTPGGTLLASIANAPLQVGYAELLLPAGIFLPANDQLVMELVYSDPAAVPVVIGPDVINFTATGSTSIRTGLSFALSTSGSWVDLATVKFKDDAFGGQAADGGILFAKGIAVVPEPSLAAVAAVAALAGGVSLRRRRASACGERESPVIAESAFSTDRGRTG